MFKELFTEKVTPDCSNGPGVIPEGPWKGFKVVRTSHLDDKRKPSNKDRDDGFDCQTFDALITKLMQKRPLGLKSGKMQITWKNKDGVQAAVINISNDQKTITFITVMQLNRSNASKYETKGAPNIDLGLVKEPN